MKRSYLYAFAPAILVAALAGNASATAISNLSLSGATAVAAGQSLTVTEKFLSNGLALTEIDSVLSFDPTVFSVSNFQVGSGFSNWTSSINSSSSSGIYEYYLHGTEQSTTASTSYNVFTFTLTALANAAAGTSNVLIIPSSSGFVTEALDFETVRSLNPAPSASFVSGIDLAVNVTSAATPEPGTFLAGAFALGGVILARRRAASRP